MANTWVAKAISRYDCCNRDTLNWVLARTTLGGFVNTKVNALSGSEYTRRSGLRGPDFTYGWIQGRALEALVVFARHYHTIDPKLSERLTETAQKLYQNLADLHARDGHAYFLYGPDFQPIRPSPNGIQPQSQAGSIYTYSDAFVAKGLFVASCQFDPSQSGRYLAYLQSVIAAIETGRFQMDEAQILSVESVDIEPDDFGPMMILMGAAGILHQAGREDETAFADRFINDVLTRYFDPESGLLLNIPGHDTCNVGHAIEFCGFAFEHLATRPDDPRIEQLISILVRSLEVGIQGPGIALSLSAKSGHAISPYYPWWPLPEAIRACSRGLKLSNDMHLLELWKRVDDLFFKNYWQSTRHFAYQTRTVDGPVDFVPATPDLDPGYHTGLSLLAATNVNSEIPN